MSIPALGMARRGESGHEPIIRTAPFPGPGTRIRRRPARPVPGVARSRSPRPGRCRRGRPRNPRRHRKPRRKAHPRRSDAAARLAPARDSGCTLRPAAAPVQRYAVAGRPGTPDRGGAPADRGRPGAPRRRSLDHHLPQRGILLGQFGQGLRCQRRLRLRQEPVARHTRLGGPAPDLLCVAGQRPRQAPARPRKGLREAPGLAPPARGDRRRRRGVPLHVRARDGRGHELRPREVRDEAARGADRTGHRAREGSPAGRPPGARAELELEISPAQATGGRPAKPQRVESSFFAPSGTDAGP